MYFIFNYYMFSYSSDSCCLGTASFALPFLFMVFYLGVVGSYLLSVLLNFLVIFLNAVSSRISPYGLH